MISEIFYYLKDYTELLTQWYIFWVRILLCASWVQFWARSIRAQKWTQIGSNIRTLKMYHWVYIESTFRGSPCIFDEVLAKIQYQKTGQNERSTLDKVPWNEWKMMKKAIERPCSCALKYLWCTCIFSYNAIYWCSCLDLVMGRALG